MRVSNSSFACVIFFLFIQMCLHENSEKWKNYSEISLIRSERENKEWFYVSLL